MSPANFQPLEVTDFSGGRTDNYVSGPMNRYQSADNLILTKHGNEAKLVSRFGCQLYSSTYPSAVAAPARLNSIRNFRTLTASTLLVQSARQMLTLGGGGWTELLGPTGNKLFPAGVTVSNVTSYAEWNDHIFYTNDAFVNPSKIFIDSGGTLRLRTAGLPRLASSPTCTPNVVGVDTYIYRFVMAYTYTVGTVTFVDRSDFTQVSKYGGPPIAISSAILDDGVTPANKIDIAAIPTLANGATTNWDTGTIKIEIYRTLKNGSIFYKVGEVTNGTAVFTDNKSDSTISANQLLYTEGGVVPNDPVPLAKLVHVTGDICYWAHIKDSSNQILSNRLRQAVPGDPDSCPEDFFVDVQDEIVGLSSTRGLPILLCKNSVYRVDGQFDELGRGAMTAQKISDTASCISSQSVVQTIEGVFWAGEDSYYFTDGYVVTKLCEDWIASYKANATSANQKARIQGKYDKRKRQIWWTTQSVTASDCDGCDILHLDWGVKRDAAFTTASGGLAYTGLNALDTTYPSSFAPSAIEFVDGDMIRGDVRGYVLIHKDSLVTDLRINTSETPSAWDNQTIIWDLKTCATNFGSSFMRKYANQIIMTCKNRSNLSLQIVSINDDGRKLENLKPIRFRGNIVWGDPTLIWGSSSIIWSFDGMIESERHFPSKSLRFSYKQLQFTNAYVPIITSDDLGTVTTSDTADPNKIATLDSSATLDFLTNLKDYYISFESDNYSRQYKIVGRTADTVTYEDTANNTPIQAGLKWEISGYPKGEVFNPLHYTISHTFMGKTQQAFTPPESGAVGT